jgi:hypothetical protein
MRRNRPAIRLIWIMDPAASFVDHCAVSPNGAGVDMVPPLRSFIARGIAPERADAAYPLARIAAPRLTIEDWRQLVAQASGEAPMPGLGILVVEDRNGYICGLATYHPAIDLEHGRTVMHAELVIPGLFDSRPVAATLLDMLRAEAGRRAASAIQVHLPAGLAAASDRAHPLAATLADAGYDASGPVARWCLALPAMAAPVIVSR